MKYSYTFSIRPFGMISDLILELFDQFIGRIEMQFTESEFAEFREEMGMKKLGLVEIERVPFVEPESIS